MASVGRDLLQVGGAGFLGLSLPPAVGSQIGFKQRRAASLAGRAVSPASFGRAKHCILLFLYGSPSQLETFDMKPEAPLEVRGTMRPIPSSLPGFDVVEHLPRTRPDHGSARQSCRSVTHPYPIHGVAFATTGVPAIDAAMELLTDRSAAPAVFRLSGRVCSPPAWNARAQYDRQYFPAVSL